MRAKGIARKRLHLTDRDQLRVLLREALQLRSIEVTERNEMSSRSHAICTILILLPTVHTPRVSGEAGDASPSSTLLYQLDSTCLPSPEGGEESRETAAEADLSLIHI